MMICPFSPPRLGLSWVDPCISYRYKIYNYVNQIKPCQELESDKLLPVMVACGGGWGGAWCGAVGAGYALEGGGGVSLRCL